MIILLDLDDPLFSNNPARGTTPARMHKRLANEQYRQWPVELVRPHTVVLITARPKPARSGRSTELRSKPDGGPRMRASQPTNPRDVCEVLNPMLLRDG
jgi:hypothetical protein